MKDEHENVVRFRPRPKRPEPPRPQAYRPSGRGGEPAIKWGKAPRALVIIGLIMLAMWLVQGLADWVSRVGVG